MNIQASDPVVHVGVVVSAETPVGMPIVHVATIPKEIYHSQRGGLLPERVALCCSRNLARACVEMVTVEATSVMCHECVLAVPEEHWDCLPVAYRDKTFRITVARMANEACGTDHYKALWLFRQSLAQPVRGDNGGDK
ncbi:MULTISPECIES: hypothetical protein [unclassified Crossiella]|uniref:hypothetical protein n=1 Tax=unclassified Crossiella TaxID=2620835 RepID=UPI001FFE3FE0|nr:MULTISPECIES: hypothetical protein [unclassified Crossiella]MCK2243481.1 hypothetical protein [Crossiella sp. S99.2]MCK2257339.1 hypothetical protein [Crossiella sp. S99.1]